MKKTVSNSRFTRYFAAIAIIASLFIGQKTYASHAAGANLTYTHVSGNQYLLHFELYRDCAGIAAPATVVVRCNSSCGSLSITLSQIAGSGVEITYPCSTATTSCSGGAATGMQKYIYEATVTLPAQCANWVFSTAIYARNASITTIANPGTDSLYVEATLNSLADQNNNSPQFSVNPILFVCVGQTFNFNNGVSDPDANDTLVYSFICPRIAPATCVTYNAGFSVASPISSAPAVSINSQTGQITMNPTTAGQVGVITVLVQDYLNGVLVGSVLRDIQVYTQACSNSSPTSSGINGTGVFDATVCAGTQICFTIPTNDVDAGQTTTITWNNGIPGGTFTSSGAPYATGNFCWTPTIADAGLNSFTVSVRDNACPSNAVAVYSFNITVRHVVTAIASQTNANCGGQSNGSATISASGGSAPYTYSWSPSGGTNATATGLAAGTYTVTVNDSYNNCPTTQTVVITQPVTVTSGVSSQANVSCNAGTNGSATVSAAGGTPGYTYSWSPSGGTNATAIGLGAGTYTVTITDTHGCTALQTVVITQPTVITSGVSTQTNANCNAQSNGSATITASGGTPGYTYSWSPSGGTGATANGLAAGTYTVTITDANTCTHTQTVVITQPTPLTGTTSHADATCGNPTGSASATGSGGTAGYSYSWNTVPVQNTQTATGLAAGGYSVTITDSHGCTAVLPVAVSNIGGPSIQASNTNVSCNGGNNASASVTVSGGTGPFTYQWTCSAQTTTTVTGLSAGGCTVTVTDANGCQASQAVTITQPAVLTAAPSHTNVSCNGGNNGTATVVVSGGTTAYTYFWNPTGQTTPTATGLGAGTYTITVTDAHGCTNSQQIVVTQPTLLTASITTSTNPSCNGSLNGTATVSAGGGTPGYTYLWIPSNQNTPTAINLGAGTYTVTVTDANGCSNTQQVVLTNPTVLSASISHADVNCSGGNNGTASVTASGGTPAYTYLWAPSGQTAATATGLVAGTYTVTITDSHGCTTTQQAVVIQPQPLTSFVSQESDPSCNGNLNGTATVNASGGTPIYTYLWTPSGQTTQTGINLGAGTYTVTITDSHSCTTTQQVVIGQPAVLTSSVTANVQPSCNGGNNGTATVSASGGSPAYNYVWNTVPAQSTATATGLSAGTYTVSITDLHGCTASQTVVVGQPTVVTGVTASTQSACRFNNGSASVTASGGTSGYTYSWNTVPVQTTATATGIGAGAYTVTITDSHGCTATATAAVSNTGAAIITASVITNANCNGDANGSATSSVISGTAPFTYAWSCTGQTTATVTGLTAGNCIVSITDGNGCVSTQSVDITEPTLLTASQTHTNLLCNGNTNGTATVSAGGGSPVYTYLWAPSGQTTATATGLGAGTYTVTVTDTHGCTVTQQSVITAPSALTASITSTTDVSCNGLSDGFATVSAGGGTPGYSYSWNTVPVQTSATAANIPAGTYTVTITDANGCTTTQTTVILQPAVLASSISSQTNVNCNGGTGSATISVTGGTSGYFYLWSPSGGSNATATGLAAGTYTVSISDSHGCTTTQTVVITQPTVLNSGISSTVAVNCNGGNTGSATVTASGGTPVYTYLWTPTGQTTATATGLVAGTYSVTVTDSHGCTSIQSVVVGEPSLLTTAATSTDAHCSQADGTVSVNASGGSPGYTYLWTPSNATTSTVIGLAAGVYTVTVTDSHGCSTTATASISNLGAASIQANVITNVNCNGGNNGSASATVISGGTAPFTYSWNTAPVQTTTTATGLSAGTYTVTVTDGNGCQTSQSVTVTQPTLLAIVTSSNNVLCNGGTGSASVTTSGGTLPYIYSWSPSGGTNSSAGGLAAGTYAVTVTDSHGCTTTHLFTITQPTVLAIASTSSTPAFCGIASGSASVTANGGTLGYSYSWNTVPIQNTATATGLLGGNYTVTVTDANGCSTTALVTVQSSVNLVASVDSLINIDCSGGATGSATITVTGGTSPYSYLWNNGQTTQTAIGLVTGTYSVVVTDLNGCSTSTQVVITGPTSPVTGILSTQTNVNCNGQSNGSATVAGNGGFPGYTYLWSPSNQTTSTGVGLSAGNYTVTITDSHGCTGTQLVQISQPNILVATVQTSTNADCFGNSTGSATAQGTGGTLAYSYSWNTQPTQNTQTATGLVAGNYIVTITDSHGCTASSQAVTISQPALLTTTAGGDQELCGNATTLNAQSLVSGQSGFWTVVTGSGTIGNPTSPITTVTNLGYGHANTFQWNLQQGPCSASATVSVVADEPVTASVNSNDSTFCLNLFNGSFDINAFSPQPGTGYWTVVTGAGTVADPYSSSTTYNVSIPANVYGVNTNVLVWTVTNGRCNSADSVVLKVLNDGTCLDLELPTGFTPNGDSYDDAYIIHGIESYPVNKFEVFNRWGNKVFSIDNYKNNSHQSADWYGQNNSGNPLPDGTYYVILTVNPGAAGEKTLNTFVYMTK